MAHALPDMNKPSEIEFLDRLQASLEIKNISSEREFCLPGSAHRVDLYIPQLPRAAVIVGVFQNTATLETAVLQAKKLHATYQAELGDTCLTIFLIFSPSDLLERTVAETAGGVLCIEMDVADPAAAEAANSAAERIKQSIDDWRSKNSSLLKVATIGVPLLSLLGMPSIPVPGIMGVVGLAALLGATVGLLNKDSGERSQSSSPQAHPSRASAPTGQPSEEAVRTVESQIKNILQTFKELVPQTYHVLTHEMEFLVAEFKLGHYTACAMRGGRSLESMIYELSRQWEIQTQDATFGELEKLRRSLDRIEDLIGDFQISPDSDRKKIEASLDEAFLSLNSNVMSLALAAKSNLQIQLPTAELAPRPVVALVKKIQKRYGHLDGVREHFKAILAKHPESGSVIDRVQRIRNRAAHADVNGNTQEIDEASVNRLIDDINVILLKLSNVGIAIKKDKAIADSKLLPLKPSSVVE